MPDPVLGTTAGTTDQTGQQGQSAGQSATQSQNGAATADPAWLSAIQDQNMREEARKSYMLQSDYTRKTQELSEKQKSWDTERDQLSRQNQEYLQGWRQSYDALQEAQTKFQQNPTKANAQNVREAQDDYWQNFDPLDGPKAGQHIAKYAVDNVTAYVNDLAQKFQQAYQTQIQQQQQYINNYFTTWLDAQQRFPGNIEQQKAYLQNLYQVQSGQIDPRELTYQHMTAQQQRQQYIEEGRKLALAEMEQRAKNQNQFDLNGNGTPAAYKYTPPGDKKARETDLNQKITEKFGYNVWNPNS